MILKKQDSKANRKHKGQEGLIQSVTNEGCDPAVHIHFHICGRWNTVNIIYLAV